jgi:hypothetical protein
MSTSLWRNNCLPASLAQFGEQLGLLDGLLKGLEEQGRLAGRLSALHSYLTLEARALQEQREDNEQESVSCRAEEQRVQLEERSDDYLRKKARHEEILQKLSVVEATARDEGIALQQAQHRSRVIRAARVAGEIAQRRAETAGIEERLAAAKEQYDADGRLRRLEYSLRLLYGSRMDAIADVVTGLNADRYDRERCSSEADHELQAADREKGLLDTERGQLEERCSASEKEEREVLRRIGLSLRRNLLGELDTADIARAGALLGKARDSLVGERSKLMAEKDAGVQRCRQIDVYLREFRADCGEEKVALSGLEREIGQYEQDERAIGEILKRYALAPELRFERERLAAAFGQHLQELDGRRDEAARDRDEAEEALRSLKTGRLHIPQEWAEVLAGLDIEYDTGESYLRSQTPAIRQRLIEGNPILPYAFIMSGADIDRMAAVVADMKARRVIPADRLRGPGNEAGERRKGGQDRRGSRLCLSLRGPGARKRESGRAGGGVRATEG